MVGDHLGKSLMYTLG